MRRFIDEGWREVIGKDARNNKLKEEANNGWRQELSEHFRRVRLLVFSSAVISNWHVLASDRRVVEQIRWWQGSGSLCCRSVFFFLWNKRQEVYLWGGMVSVRDVWLRRCIVDVQSEATGRVVFVLWCMRFGWTICAIESCNILFCTVILEL
jgi:hypothetical protein